MQITLTWATFGPGIQTGATLVQEYLRSIGASNVRIASIESAPVTITNVRRERDAATGELDQGYMADVSSALSGLRGGLIFLHPSAWEDRLSTEAEIAQIPTMISRITTGSVTTITATVPSAPRALAQTLNARLGAFLRDNGGFFLQGNGVRIREQRSSGWLGLVGLGLLAVGAYALRSSR
jgi:hypothetical protein